MASLTFAPNFNSKNIGLRFIVMIRSFGTFVALFLFWLLLSGIFTPFLVAAGVGSAIAVVLFARRMEVIGGGSQEMQIVWTQFLPYWPWLIKEIVVAAWDVTKRILHPNLPVSPTLVEFTPAQMTEFGLIVHANSITLTPGTITVEAEPGRFLVHSLTRAAAATLEGSEMDRRCAALEKR